MLIHHPADADHSRGDRSVQLFRTKMLRWVGLSVPHGCFSKNCPAETWRVSRRMPHSGNRLPSIRRGMEWAGVPDLLSLELYAANAVVPPKRCSQQQACYGRVTAHTLVMYKPLFAVVGCHRDEIELPHFPESGP